MATSKRERQKAARREKVERMQREARRRRTLRRGVIIAIVAVVVIGSAALLFSGTKTPTTTTTTSTTVASTTTTTTIPKADQTKQINANAAAVRAGCPASPHARVNTLTWKTQPKVTITATGTYYAHVATTAGNVVIKLEPSLALKTVNNFIFLAQHHYYNCVIFHRVIPGFVIQGGDPTGIGSGSPGYTIPDELPKAGHPTYPLYSLAMANAGTANTGAAQFFIITGSQGESLPAAYSLFGQVISGQSVLKTINAEGGPYPAGTPVVVQRMLTITISSAP
jgi:cyclophilin family peptidyl-prolyl cis-trans isomerase